MSRRQPRRTATAVLRKPRRERGRRLASVAKFGLVGLSGLVCNTLVLALVTGVAGLHYLVGTVFATQVSTTWNFALSGYWVFGGEVEHTHNLLTRYVRFSGVNNAMLVLRGPMIVALSKLGLHYLAANAVSLIVMFAARFALADRWIWRAAHR